MSLVEYAEIQEALKAAHSLTEASEAHGTLAGCLCATVAYRFEDWLAEILPEGRADPRATRTLRDLFERTAGALGEDQMEFAPLLPEDAEPIDTRASALGLWCQGFLYGLGASPITDARELPGEAGEIVRDLSEITRVGVDEADSLESNEGAYAELVEFVRVGVQLLFEELEPLRAQPPRSDDALH
ncbi:MAG TPA: UPF0149 family protein [Steroidobacteraceae bacterium]|nr:UPF0149 family protein [Steroidobacteraceae bacterium]